MRSSEGKRGGILGIILVILFLLVILVCTTAFFYVQNMGSPYKKDSDEYIQIKIPEGTSASGVGDILQDKGVVRFSHEFNIYSRLNRLSAKYQAGTYALSPGMDMKEIARIISTGETNSIKVTIPEGYSQSDVAKALVEKGLTTDKKFRKAVSSPSLKREYPFLRKTTNDDNVLEGYLFPMTYEIQAGTGIDAIVRMMLDEYSKVFTPAFRARAKKLKMTENDIVTIASIIEKECGTADDHKVVSSVIYNRLKKKMPLQMDSTIQYIIDLQGGEKKRDLSNADTHIPSPYNTYLHKGLPKGPICSPGASAIEAALFPAKTDYLYFVLSDKLDGTSVFSSNYDDFLEDKAAYYRELEKQDSEN